MPNEFKKMLMLSAFSLMIISPAYGDYWDYYGSGRDHPYSAYINRSNYIGPADYSLIEPDNIDWSVYINNGIPPPAITPVPARLMTQVPAPLVDQQDEFTVNVPNDHRGYTPVVIKRSGNGFTGPQGEYYPEFPKVFQLKMMYGK